MPGHCNESHPGLVHRPTQQRQRKYHLSKIVVIRPNRCSTFENCVDNLFVDEKDSAEFELVHYVWRAGWGGDRSICSCASYVIVVQHMQARSERRFGDIYLLPPSSPSSTTLPNASQRSPEVEISKGPNHRDAKTTVVAEVSRFGQGDRPGKPSSSLQGAEKTQARSGEGSEVES